jgi:hypothetical protein
MHDERGTTHRLMSRLFPGVSGPRSRRPRRNSNRERPETGFTVSHSKQMIAFLSNRNFSRVISSGFYRGPWITRLTRVTLAQGYLSNPPNSNRNTSGLEIAATHSKCRALFSLIATRKLFME